MKVWRAIRDSLSLLSERDRRKLYLATVVQVATAILDLIGVLLLGLVGALAVTDSNTQDLPPQFQSILDSLGLGGMSSAQLLALVATLAAAVLLGKSAVSAALMRRVFRFLAGRQAVLSAELTQLLLGQPWTVVLRRSSQETAYALIQGASAATIAVLGQAVIAVSELALLTTLSVALLAFSPLVALGSIAYFAIVAVSLQRLLGDRAAGWGRVAAQADIVSLDTVQEAIGSYREIVVGSRRHFYVHRIAALRWQAADVLAELQFMATLPKYIFEAALVLGMALLAAALLATEDLISAVATLALFIAAASRVMPSILRLQGAALTLRNASAVAEPTLHLASTLGLRGPSGPTAETHAAHTPKHGDSIFRPDISMTNVSFSYPGADHRAIDDVTLYVPKGEFAALVGSSGAGKSTLADLILGVIEADSGIVRVGGEPPSRAVDIWPGRIAYVPQDVAVANGTIRANVALGIPAEMIDDDLVWEALRRARLADVVTRRGLGLDEVVGERGVRLSGGQRQRLGIARALFSQPELIVLDEATSALDAETEVAVAQALSELDGAVTRIVIAHRLSTVRHADRVLFLRRGRIICDDTFEEVRRKVPEFETQAKLMGL